MSGPMNEAARPAITTGPTGAVHQRLRERRFRGESGLTTLEWLLIVAAVAGLAALAVVLVTNVVRDTTDELSGSSARLTAARTQAAALTAKARDTDATGANTAAMNAHAVQLNLDFKSDCNQIEVLYKDIQGLDAIWSTDITTASPAAGDVALATDWNAAAPTYGCHIST